MNGIPKDPVILLSYVNTQLRDNYPSLDEMCRALRSLMKRAGLTIEEAPRD